MNVLSVARLYLNWYMYFVLEFIYLSIPIMYKRKVGANVCVSIYVFVKINYNKA